MLLAAPVVFYFLSRSGQAVVEIRDQAPWFFPAAVKIEPGATVTWRLKAYAVHPVMTLEGPEEIHSGHFTKEYSYTFQKPGVYVYICPIHPYMKGVIAVGTKIPQDKIPAWADWPPEATPVPAGPPQMSGAGKIWLAAQFHETANKNKPGSIFVINAETWEIETVIADEGLNNPHNLWEASGKILVTNWFDKYLSVVDKISKKIEKQILVGESPAHIHGSADKLYVTVQGEDAIAILDKNFEVSQKIRAPKGPHGHWMSENSPIMAVASTEKGKISVWDTGSDTILFEEFVNGGSENGHEDTHADSEHTHSLPLMAGLTADGKFAFTAGSGNGKFYVFDVARKKLIKSFELGPGPIQTVISPDDRFVLVPLSGSGEVAVVATKDWSLVKKIANVGAGAHAVAYGQRGDGKWYAYVSNKFAAWITVIDIEKLDVTGYIPLPPEALGGQGILITDN